MRMDFSYQLDGASNCSVSDYHVLTCIFRDFGRRNAKLGRLLRAYANLSFEFAGNNISLLSIMHNIIASLVAKILL